MDRFDFAALERQFATEQNQQTRKNPKKKRKLATFDIETDPFLYGRKPEPFCCHVCILDSPGVRKDHSFWGDDCLDQALWFLWTCEPLKMYAHNGGKFDFMYFLYNGWLSEKPRMINGRIVEAKLDHHLIRDSFAIIPVPLEAYRKTDIDYTKFEADQREHYKGEILDYLKDDCHDLMDLVQEFNDRFGDYLTVGSLAIKKLRSFHPFENITKEQDEVIRPYYFGGRVQCFETGLLRGNFKVYDVNSMYPAVMSKCDHPRGETMITLHDESDIMQYIDLKTMTSVFNTPFFLTFEGRNNGAIPTRTKQGLDFTVSEGEFHACSHELRVAVEYGLIEIDRVKAAVVFMDSIRFDEYVDTYMQDKIAAKESGDTIQELFSKLLLNSAYGKTAQNPENYYDWWFIDEDEDPINRVKAANMEIVEEYVTETGNPFDLEDDDAPSLWEFEGNSDDYMIFKKSADNSSYFDVAMGASITSAARSVLLRAIMEAKRPLYCDTDSLICEAIGAVDKHPSRLGAWDLEKEGQTLAIAGKKLYALHDGVEWAKVACKGVQLSGDDIARLAADETVAWYSQAPTFKPTGDVLYMQRILNAEKHSKIYDQNARRIRGENLPPENPQQNKGKIDKEFLDQVLTVFG